MEISVPYDNITFDASAKTITLTGYYSGISREQIQQIKNLTTGDTLYNCLFPNKYNISVSSGVITHTYDNSNHSDTDIIQVTVMLTETMGYNSDKNSLNVVEQGPIDQQVLNEKPLNAVTVTGASTAINTLDKSRIILAVEVSNIGTGCDIQVEGSPNGDDWDTNKGQLRLTSADGTTSSTKTFASNGLYFFTVDNVPQYVRVNVTARDTETVSAWIQGGAI